MTHLSIPTLDLQAFDSIDSRAAFVIQLGKVYEQYGFCGIRGHGVSEDLIDRAYRSLKAFFALPDATKRRYSGVRGGARGYTGLGVEKAKDSAFVDLKEFWHVGREIDSKHSDGREIHHSLLPNVWPEEVAEFRRDLYTLYTALDDLGNRLLDVMALYLELPVDFFRDKVDLGNSILRPIHYPPIDQMQTQSMRAAPHEDINLITLLVGSHEPGLEVLARTGEWLSVDVGADTIVVNIGDMMQRLTNHLLPSTTHRVVNSPAAFTGESRYSIPFFLHPNPEYEIVTLPSCVSPANPDRYPDPITADAYLTQRLAEIGLLSDAI